MILSSGWSMDYQVGVGPTRYLSAEFGGSAHPLMPHSCLFTRPGPHPSSPISTLPPSHLPATSELFYSLEKELFGNQTRKLLTYIYQGKRR